VSMKRISISLIGAISLCTFLFTAALGQVKPAAKKPSSTTTTRKPSMTNHVDLLNPSSLHETAPDVYEAKFSTTKGDFVVHVTRAWAPFGADRFYNLVKHHFYDHASFFRVVPGFVVQFGLSADPKVSRAWQNATIRDDRVTQSNKPGFVTFATAGPNTRTTQIFINLGNNGGLDSQGFSPFGEVTQGMDIVKQLYSSYGESPDQGQITSKGKAYLDLSFPKLDSIKTAVIVSGAAPAAPADHPAPKKP
jgi:peptidyl-prolyl cis-trans isomerase A (cyclophilin A)